MAQATFNGTSLNPLFDALSVARMTQDKRDFIHNSLNEFIDDLESGDATPSLASFGHMISFLESHPELPVPMIGLNYRDGTFTIAYDEKSGDERHRASFSVKFRANDVIDETTIDSTRKPADVNIRNAIRPDAVQLPDLVKPNGQTTLQP